MYLYDSSKRPWRGTASVLKLGPDGREQWLREYDGYINTRAMIMTDGDDMALLCEKQNNTGYPDVPALIRIKSSGDIMKADIIGPGTEKYYDMCRTGDNGFVLCGFESVDRQSRFALLAKIDKDGKRIW
jgi:hypothetical protein